MSRTKMFFAGAIVAAGCLVASGPALATATTLLIDDGPTGTSFSFFFDGVFHNSFGPLADHQGTTNSISEFLNGSTFSFPTTDITILEPGTSLVSDSLELSQVLLGGDGKTLIVNFGSNDGPAINLITFNPVTETGLLQTLFSTQDELGNTLQVQFLSEADAPGGTSNSVPEPSTFALFGAVLAAFGMLMRRRTARSIV